MTVSKTTATAIVVGAALGAALALGGGQRSAPPGARRAPSPPVRPRAPVTTRADASAADAAATRDGSPPADASGVALAASARPPTPDPAESRSAQELTIACARRDPSACLAAADAFESGRGVLADAAKARLHRSLAVSLLDERCTARKAGACSDLAGLYESGTGVDKNADTARALRDRALRLCEGNADADCERLRAGLLR